FNADEATILVGGTAFAGHPVVSVGTDRFTQGSAWLAADLVAPAGAVGDLNTLAHGTKFLTQFHSNAGALLSALDPHLGDGAAIPPMLNSQVVSSFGPGIGGLPLLVIWLDPVAIDLADPQGARTVYNLQSNSLSNQAGRGFVEMGGNIQVIVMAGMTGTF